MKEIKLIALDVDGTLYNDQGEISPKNIEAIKKAGEAGVAVAVATGRSCSELPVEELYRLGIHYAITGNGSGVYRLPDKKCIYSDCLDTQILLKILEELEELDIYYDIYIDGVVYCPRSVLHNIRRLDMPESLQELIEQTRNIVDDLRQFILEQGKSVEKTTTNFALMPDGTYLDRERTAQILDRYPQVQYLCGGYHNLEFTKAGVTKGSGLRFLAEKIGISVENSMVCGDSENDLFMFREAGISVAMENAGAEIKEQADYVTRSNNESGVGYAIEQFVFAGK